MMKIKKGDKVLLSIKDRFVGNAAKLGQIFEGPFKITEICNDVSYRLQRMDDPDSKPVVAHVSKLKRYTRGDEEANGDETIILNQQGDESEKQEGQN